MARSTHAVSDAGFAPGFVARVLDDALAQPCRVYGIAGLPGSGKSTLAAQVAAQAKTRGLAVSVLSIDDFYLGHRERQRLGRNVHPLLATRGPPGTHDIALACAVIDSLRAGAVTALPHFDKLTDRRLPPSRWKMVRSKPDLIVFEGWFLKTPAQDAAALRDPVNALERDDDPDGIWRNHCNRALASYTPLWQRIDRLLFLQGPDSGAVREWRWQQQVALQTKHPRSKPASRADIERFVRFFERIGRHAMQTLPAIADRTIRIDKDRKPNDA